MKYKIVYLPSFELKGEADSIVEAEKFIYDNILCDDCVKEVDKYDEDILCTGCGAECDIIEEDEYNELIVGFDNA